MKNIIKISFFCFLFLLFFANQSFAQTSGCPTGLVPCGGQDCPCQFCHFFIMFDNIFNFVLFRIVPIVAALLIAIAGFMFIFGYADQQGATINKAKELFKAIIIGMVIIYCAWLIVNLFFTAMGVKIFNPSTGQNWFEIDCPISNTPPPANQGTVPTPGQQNQSNQQGQQNQSNQSNISIPIQKKCEDCGKGFVNRCDMVECAKLGNCTFVAHLFWGECKPLEQ